MVASERTKINRMRFPMRLLILVFMFLTINAIAQEQPHTIKVNARVIYIDPDPTYKADISLSTAFSSYDKNVLSLDQMVERFKKSVTENGLSWNDIKEYPGVFGFETMGYNKEGIIYQYETKSAENMKQFLSLQLPIINRLDMSSTIEISSEEAAKITQMALDKALKQATLLAKTAKRQVGAVLAIKENGGLFGKPYGISLHYNRPPGEFYYDVEVTYELK